jgi:hypothetical protein
VTPDASVIADSWALLRFGWRDGFFYAAVLGLIRTFFSDYWQLQTKIGLTCYRERDIADKLVRGRLQGHRASANLSYLATRMTFLGR